MIDLRIVDALSQGRDELGLLLYSGTSPDWLARRVDDGRNDAELMYDWTAKVCAAGLTEEAALSFLNARLACE